MVIHIYYGILLGHKKDKILPFVVAWMDLEGIILNEISQKKKDEYFVISVICVI